MHGPASDNEEGDVWKTPEQRASDSVSRGQRWAEGILATLLMQLRESIKAEYYNLWPISCFHSS